MKRLTFRGAFWIAYLAVVFFVALFCAVARAQSTAGAWVVVSGTDSLGYTWPDAGGAALVPSAFCASYGAHITQAGAVDVVCGTSAVGGVYQAVVTGTGSNGSLFSYTFSCSLCTVDAAPPAGGASSPSGGLPASDMLFAVGLVLSMALGWVAGQQR